MGAIGFAVDAGILAILSNGLGVNPIISRIPSFGLAVLTTFLLNSAWTFRDRQIARERAPLFRRYLGVQIIGVTVNLSIYSGLVTVSALARNWPVIPLAVASAIVMLLNYSLSNTLVFGVERDDGND